MSSRRLGGGRILGNGKGLGPTPPTAPRASSPLAISESNVSQTSSSVSPPASGSLSDLGHDIRSNISVGAQPKGSAADATGLVCPICNEEMVTLLQLNRHIDDTHQELPAEEQNEVKTWFDKQVLKAKRFQPLSLINMKLRGLDVFESNESNLVPPPSLPQPTSSAAGKLPLEVPVDPEELITRTHWQRTTTNDLCTDPACGKGLGPINGSINCRKCGRLFCEEHTMYQMKLSRSANHEPVRGYWARTTRMHLLKQEKETGKAESGGFETGKTLDEADSVIGESTRSTDSAIEWLIAWALTWEEDERVSQCPFCQQEFGSWTFRRHHCRICGRVVCGDPQTGCSSEVSLNVSNTSYRPNEKPLVSTVNGHLTVDVRMCKDCNYTIFSGRDFTASLLHKPPDQRAYETLRQFERGIRQLLPSFQRTLIALQPEVRENGEIDLNRPPPTHAQIQEASKIRKRLIDSFTKYGSAAKRLRDLKAENPTQEKLQAAIYGYANNFLHINMLPLKSVPQMLRRRSTPSTSSSHSNYLSVPHHSTSSLRHSELAESETASQAPSEASTVVSQLETEEKDLKERLAVLEEQKFMVEEMVRTATAARRFEEVSALSRNVDELDGEINGLRKKIGDVEQRWEGVYRNGS
ncbi:Vacuolar segregation PEP7-like protein [Cladobotryum mycophilum]|uniref:Vacuolar segregation PEP7-like protein n=1 Tax=Cladobotryum mycophilum TaxID=491253 RepID=A0ABR0SXT2_9HYPO